MRKTALFLGTIALLLVCFNVFAKEGGWTLQETCTLGQSYSYSGCESCSASAEGRVCSGSCDGVGYDLVCEGTGNGVSYCGCHK